MRLFDFRRALLGVAQSAVDEAESSGKRRRCFSSSSRRTVADQVCAFERRRRRSRKNWRADFARRTRGRSVAARAASLLKLQRLSRGPNRPFDRAEGQLVNERIRPSVFLLLGRPSHRPKDSVCERSLVAPIPVNGITIPCSRVEGISRQMPGAQKLLRFCATSRPQIREESL